MILRLFLILLAVNSIAFVARADAAEKDESRSPQLWEMVGMAEAGDAEEMDEEIFELADLGARFLKWRFSGDEEGVRYASERISSDHGLAMVEDGAALNLKWRF